MLVITATQLYSKRHGLPNPALQAICSPCVMHLCLLVCREVRLALIIQNMDTRCTLWQLAGQPKSWHAAVRKGPLGCNPKGPLACPSESLAQMGCAHSPGLSLWPQVVCIRESHLRRQMS